MRFRASLVLLPLEMRPHKISKFLKFSQVSFRIDEEVEVFFSRKLQRRVLRQIASPIQHSITQHNITPQQDTPQQDPPQHHTPQQDIHRSKTPHLQTGLCCILIIFLIIS